MAHTIPIILFVYARPDHLRRTLECLKANHVPLINIFSDGPKTPDKEPAVKEVRKILTSPLCGIRCSIFASTPFAK